MPKFNCKLRRESAFSLFEILIAIALLALISIAISQATIRSFQLNQSVAVEADGAVSLIVTLDAIERDIAQMYSLPYDFPAQAQETNPQRPSLSWSAPLRDDGLRRTRFFGNEAKISFIANSNRRVNKNSRESDFQKITWEIVSEGGKFSLTRTRDLDAFNYQDHSISGEEPQRFTILDNIKSAKFEYYRKSKDTWDKEWDSENQYATSADRFPSMIALNLEVSDPKNAENSVHWRRQFRSNLELNLVAEKSSGTNTSTGTTAPAPNETTPQNPNEGGQ